MIDASMPQIETITLAQYFGLDIEVLRDHLGGDGGCEVEDEVIQMEIARELPKGLQEVIAE